MHCWALNLLGRYLGPTPDHKSPSQLPLNSVRESVTGITHFDRDNISPVVKSPSLHRANLLSFPGHVPRLTAFSSKVARLALRLFIPSLQS
ncbi:hypothetical protein HYC85_028415 [Camellia sinensis]|uniref:Uncharacterized protein n=1 Tax=Camellia sinensis TaxID=4442 RepID=A0A7J7FZ51_CAMSI|nr:hypothetical protein HYC85_028415 [Camellia sinensis]